MEKLSTSKKLIAAFMATLAIAGVYIGTVKVRSSSATEADAQDEIIVTEDVTTESEQVQNIAETTEIKTTPVTTSTSVTTTTTIQTTTTITTAIPTVGVDNVIAEAVGVSCIKVTWDAEEEREYEVGYSTDAPYAENIEFLFPEKGTCYLTGLRENSSYDIEVSPILQENEKAEVSSSKTNVHTQAVEVIQEFDYEEGWTNCFAGERASGLTAMPSSGAIYGSFADNITGTGIRRFENGDYCCAMGTFYGYCNDRFLVELDNGIQFTVRICDSKGLADDADGDGEPDGRFHWFGGTGNGKCIIEFIYDDYNLPSCVSFSGSWGGYNWNGLNLGANIKSIKKLASW